MDAKPSRVPGAKVRDEAADDSKGETEPCSDELELEEARQHRAIEFRVNYFAVDKMDIQFAVTEAAWAISSPRQSHWAMLHKIGRYLAGVPRLVMKFPWQKAPTRVTAFTDSDWAVCVSTVRSTSGGIVMIGAHTIKSYSRQQKVVALPSAEAELYAMVAASAESLAVIGYAQVLGVGLEGEVFTDSSAALGIARRAGIGKVRHLRTQGLWVQEVRVTNRLKYLKVLGAKNPADVLTQHVPADLLERHLEATGMAATDGRAAAAPELNTLESVLFLCDAPPEIKVVRFAATVSYRSVPTVGKGRKVGRHGGGEPPIVRRCEAEDEPSASRDLGAGACLPKRSLRWASGSLLDHREGLEGRRRQGRRHVGEACRGSKNKEAPMGRRRRFGRGWPGAECCGGGQREREVRCIFDIGQVPVQIRCIQPMAQRSAQSRCVHVLVVACTASREGRALGVDTHTHSFVGKSGRCVGLG